MTIFSEVRGEKLQKVQNAKKVDQLAQISPLKCVKTLGLWFSPLHKHNIRFETTPNKFHFKTLKYTGFIDKKVSIGGMQFAKSQNLKFHNFLSTKVTELKFSRTLTYFKVFKVC